MAEEIIKQIEEIFRPSMMPMEWCKVGYWKKCPKCEALGKIDEEQFLGKVSIECSECGHHYHRERGMIKLRKIRIKYLRKGGTQSTTFWSERKVGQVIEEDAFGGMIDEVLEIEGIPDTAEKPQQSKMEGEVEI